MGSKEKLYCRKVPFVLRYHVPNEYKYPEKYAYHLVILSYPFRKEFELNSRNNLTYTEKLFDNKVLDIVNFNKAQIEPYGELINSAFSQFRSDFNHNISITDSFAQQENDEVIDQEGENNPSFEEQDENNVESSTESSAVDFSIANSENILADEDISVKIRSLNKEQKKVFDFVHKWARDHVKYRSSKRKKEVQPVHLFNTGGGVCGKSHLLRTVY